MRVIGKLHDALYDRYMLNGITYLTVMRLLILHGGGRSFWSKAPTSFRKISGTICASDYMTSNAFRNSVLSLINTAASCQRGNVYETIPTNQENSTVIYSIPQLPCATIWGWQFHCTYIRAISTHFFLFHEFTRLCSPDFPVHCFGTSRGSIILIFIDLLTTSYRNGLFKEVNQSVQVTKNP